MARVSNPNSTRLGITSYWESSSLGGSTVHEVLIFFWLSQTFRKMFEATRERITLFADIYFKNYNIFIYIILAVTELIFWKKKRARLKKRIFFSLFKKKDFRRKYTKIKKIAKTQYNKLLTFILEKNMRFNSYCDLLCSRFQQDFLTKLLKVVPVFHPANVLFFDIPFKLKITNLFSVVAREYSYIWRVFYAHASSYLWYARKMRYFISTLKICFFFMFVPNAQVMVNHIAYLLQKSRKHWTVLKTLKQLFSLFAIYLPVFRTFKIKITGCINDSERTRSVTLGQNFVVTQTFDQPLNYAIAHAATPFGALGLKIWILT